MLWVISQSHGRNDMRRFGGLQCSADVRFRIYVRGVRDGRRGVRDAMRGVGVGMRGVRVGIRGVRFGMRGVRDGRRGVRDGMRGVGVIGEW